MASTVGRPRLADAVNSQEVIVTDEMADLQDVSRVPAPQERDRDGTG